VPSHTQNEVHVTAVRISIVLALLATGASLATDHYVGISAGSDTYAWLCCPCNQRLFTNCSFNAWKAIIHRMKKLQAFQLIFS
jgi:hypothetical protein